MSVRTTVDIPETLHQSLRHRAEQSGSSMRALIVRAIEQVYSDSGKTEYLTGPLITGRGKLGRVFPKDENPHDVVFS